MNDHQMSILTSSHTSALLDEARRQRLANSGPRHQHQAGPAEKRRFPRLTLGALLGRASA